MAPRTARRPRRRPYTGPSATTGRSSTRTSRRAAAASPLLRQSRALFKPAADHGSNPRKYTAIQNQSPMLGAVSLEVIGRERKIVVPLSGPLRVGRAGDDHPRARRGAESDAGLALITSQA